MSIGPIVLVLLALPVMVAQSPDMRLRDHLRLDGTQLDLRGTAVTDGDLCALDAVEFRPVRSALLTATRTGDEGLECLRRLPHLVQLDLGRTAVTDAGLQHLEGMPIERLELTGTAVTDAGLSHLRSMPLRIVVLRDTKIAGPGLEAFAGAELTLLDLAHTAVQEDAIALLAKVKRLETLVLSETKVRDGVLHHLGEIPGLKAADLAGTTVTPMAVAHFRRSNPGIEINTEPPVR
jgi:internalin A